MEDLEELFTEGWREPGDDAMRLAYEIGAGLIVALLFVFTGFFAYDLVKPALHLVPDIPLMWDVISAVVCVGAAVMLGRWLWSEVQKCRVKLTAERVVSGGFLTAVSILILSLLVVRETLGSPEAWLLPVAGFGISGAIALASLGAGLGFAFWPRLFPPRFLGVRVIDRYALDERAVRVDGHPCPWEDHLVPVITVIDHGGRKRNLRVAPTCYDSVQPGTVVDLVIREGRVAQASRAR